MRDTWLIILLTQAYQDPLWYGARGRYTTGHDGQVNTIGRARGKHFPVNSQRARLLVCVFPSPWHRALSGLSVAQFITPDHRFHCFHVSFFMLGYGCGSCWFIPSPHLCLSPSVSLLTWISWKQKRKQSIIWSLVWILYAAVIEHGSVIDIIFIDGGGLVYRKASHVLHQYEIMSHDTILLGWLPRFQLIVNPFSWSTHEMNGGLFAIHYFLRGFQHEGYLDCKS